MTPPDVYEKLARHLSTLGMGYPPTETLIDILKENFSPVEAEVASALPTSVIPLQPVLKLRDVHKKLRNQSIKSYFSLCQFLFWCSAETPRQIESCSV